MSWSLPSGESVDLRQGGRDRFEHFVRSGMTAIDVLHVREEFADVFQGHIAPIEQRTAAPFDLAQNRDGLRNGFGRVEQLVGSVLATLDGIERRNQAFSRQLCKLNGFHETSSTKTNRSSGASA